MPQMKPMNWMMMYLFLNLILMMMNIMNYFINININYKNFIYKFKSNNKLLKWKW